MEQEKEEDNVSFSFNLERKFCRVRVKIDVIRKKVASYVMSDKNYFYKIKHKNILVYRRKAKSIFHLIVLKLFFRNLYFPSFLYEEIALLLRKLLVGVNAQAQNHVACLTSKRKKNKKKRKGNSFKIKNKKCSL